MKSRLVILDANIVIAAFRGGFWKSIIAQYQVNIPSIVLHQEVYHYVDENEQKVPIDLVQYIAAGKIQEISAKPQEIAYLEEKVNPNFLDRIDDGEKEAIALLLTGNFDEHRYCTADTRAIKALASLNLGAFGVSLEELLSKIGEAKKLPDESYSKRAFDLKKAQGLQEQSMFLKS
ncbi:MAG: hypothetical protein HY537_09105 [Deltaproteobacteria bacterium]|nr:hypothetical protein [Deltaproteobacteria bacterium]